MRKKKHVALGLEKQYFKFSAKMLRLYCVGAFNLHSNLFLFLC